MIFLFFFASFAYMGDHKAITFFEEAVTDFPAPSALPRPSVLRGESAGGGHNGLVFSVQWYSSGFGGFP